MQEWKGMKGWGMKDEELELNETIVATLMKLEPAAA